MMDAEFKPAEGITIGNAIRYILAIEEAVIRDIYKIEPKMRGFSLTAIRIAISLAGRTLDRLKAELEKEADTDQMTSEQERDISYLLKFSDKDIKN